MATTRSATTVWKGDLASGSGQTTLDSSGLGTYDVTWKARAEQAEGKTSPEELLAAAHASCFSMALSNVLKQAGHTADSLETRAEVDFDGNAAKITEVRLSVTGSVPGISQEDFQSSAEAARGGCPVSQALAVPIKLTGATLNS